MTSIRFDSITGQDGAVAHLQNALRTGQISQAYLISGEKGAGKRDLAMAFSAALQCEHPREENGRIEPCGTCRSCRQILAGSHPDVITVTNELAGTQTKTNTVGVKTARFVQGDVGLRPYEGPWKIYVIPDAQNMNQQAQNALLKTLEEPPSYALLLLLSENTSVFLPTVLSRCVMLQLRAAPEEAIVRMLEREGAQAGSARLAAKLSHGNPGRARALAGEELTARRTKALDLLRRMPKVNAREIVVFSEELAAKGKEDGGAAVEDFLDLGRSWLRDLLAAKAGAGEGGLIFQDEVQYISTIAENLSFRSLEAALQAFDQADRCRAAKIGDVQILQTLLLRIRRSMMPAKGKG